MPTRSRFQQPRLKAHQKMEGLVKVRHEKGLLLRDVADRAKVSRDVISKLESEGGLASNHPKLRQIAAAYKLSVDDLAPYLKAPMAEYNVKALKRAPAPKPVTVVPVDNGPRVRRDSTHESPLAAIRRAKGLTITVLAQKAKVDRKLLAHIETMRGNVSPELKSLPRVAAAYGVKLEALQSELRTTFASSGAPPATPRVVPITSDMNPFAAYRATNSLSIKSIMQASDVGQKTIEDLEHGRLGPNHPYLPHLAAAYKMTVDQLLPFCNGPLMTDKYVKKLTTQRDNRQKKGKKADTLPKGVRLVHAPKTNLAQLAKAVTRTPTVYNKLKKVPLAVRQFVRALASEVNMQIMAGHKEVVLPPFPTAVLREFAHDYMQAKGIKGTMLLDANFADHFD